MENKNIAYVNLLSEDKQKNGLLGFATVMYNGLRISGLQIRLKKDGENTYIEFPHTFRMKNGEYVKDENGYSIKDYIVNPLSKEVRGEIEMLVDEAFAKVLDESSKEA